MSGEAELVPKNESQDYHIQEQGLVQEQAPPKQEQVQLYTIRPSLYIQNFDASRENKFECRTFFLLIRVLPV